MAGLVQRIRENYPTLAFLINDPEIGPLLKRAVDPNKGFSPQTFQAKLYQTKWWTKQSQTKREWLIRKNTDPAQAKQDRNQFKSGLTQFSRQLGVNLSQNQLQLLSELAMQQGITDPSDPRIQYGLRKLYGKKDYGKGQIGALTQQLKSMATGAYMRPMSNSEARRWALNIATGGGTMEGAQQKMMLDAQKRYPWLADQIRQGSTVADIVAPLREIVANELELGSANNVDVMTSPTWRKLLGVRDPKTKKMRMMTESDAMKLARSRPNWWKTSKGRESDFSMTQSLLKTFGIRK